MPSPPIPRLKKMVELTLKENPSWRNIEVRNSDIALMVIIWQRWYNVGTNDDSVVHLHRLLDLPREDNIKRVRAVFQNVEHRFLPTVWDIAKKRGIERELWESELGYSRDPATVRRHKELIAESMPPKLGPTEEGGQGTLFEIPPKRSNNYGL